MKQYRYEFRKARKIYLNYIQNQIGKLYIYLSWCYYKVPKYFNKDDFLCINTSSEKVFTKQIAQYIIDILNKIRMMPDVIGPSTCGQYIMFHYYYKKEYLKVRFYIDRGGSRVLHYDEDINVPYYTNPIQPNNIKEVAWHIDDSTYLWDGVHPSND